MNKKSRNLILVSLLLLTMIALAFGQRQKNELLEQKVSAFQVADAPASMVLQRLATKYGVPIGIEATPDKSGATTRITVKVEDGTVQDILNAVTKADSDYNWLKTDSVINVFPKHAADPLLETAVARYEVKNVNTEQAIRNLQGSPEVRQQLDKIGVKERTLQTLTSEPLNKQQQFSITLENSTVRNILNEIMKASGSHYWIFFRYGTNNEYFSLTMQ